MTASVTSRMADELVETARSLGQLLTYQKVTDGFGNCFFEAIINQICCRQEIRKSLPSHIQESCLAVDHIQLRQSVVQLLQMMSNDHGSRNQVLQSYIDLYNTTYHPPTHPQTWDEFLRSMGKPGVWAEDVVIHATAWYLNTDVWIISKHQTPQQPFLKVSSQSSTEQDVNKPPIILGYISDQHFQSLIPVHQLQQTNEENTTSSSLKCLGCGKEGFAFILNHLKKSNLCKAQYNMDELRKCAEIRRQAKRRLCRQAQNKDKRNLQLEIGERQNKYQILERKQNKSECLDDHQKEASTDHMEGIRQKQRIYDSDHRKEIRQKQRIYDSDDRKGIRQKQQKSVEYHREEIRRKQQKYNTDHREEIRRKQQKYDTDHLEEIRRKQQKYDADHVEEIRRKQQKYDEYHREEIRRKQQKYNTDHLEEIRRKQQKYDADHLEEIRREQQKYDAAHLEEIRRKQQKYDADHLEEIRRKQQKYNTDHLEEIRRKQQKYDAAHLEEIRRKQQKYDAAHLEEIRRKQKKYHADHLEEIRRKQQKYNTDHLEEIRQKQQKYNTGHRQEIRQKQQTYNTDYQEEVRQRQRKYSYDHQNQVKDNQKHYRLVTFENFDASQRYKTFQREVKQGPVYPCVSCHRMLYRNGVQIFNPNQIGKSMQELFTTWLQTIPRSFRTENNYWICHNCKVKLKKNEMPAMCFANGLQMDEIPEELNLTDLENSLVARNILFLKLLRLPTSRWSAVRDKVVNIPMAGKDVISTVEKLPRTPSEAGIVPIKLKRKLSYKHCVTEQYIRPQKLEKALQTLHRLGHPYYQFVELNEHFLQRCKQEDPHGYITLFEGATGSDETNLCTENHEMDIPPEFQQKTNGDDIDDDEEEEYRRMDPVRRHQYDFESATLMTDKFPESSIYTKPKNSASTSSVAPAENKIPTNLMREKDWDVKAFPTLYPSGKFGLDFQRKVPLSPQKYFLQRTLNVDRRFVNNTPFVFAALYFIERQQLERNVNISYLRKRVSGEKAISLEDAFSVFDQVSGTPRYWQQARYEMVAKLEQLGPFQFFFTLSCADKRWTENITTSLSNRGHNIIYTKGDSSQRQEENVFVDGVPLETLLETINLHELIQQNVLTVTLNFDHRVRSFRKNIIMGVNNPMHVKFFNYRVEFQMRGAAHIHGVLWLDMKAIESKFTGLNSALDKLKNDQSLGEDERKVITSFVDTFVTCSLDTDLKSIVEEVQIHHHTKACRKYGGKCRFSYPKYPSKRTIVTQPLKPTLSSKEKEALLKIHKDTLKVVRDALEDDELDMTLSIEDLLRNLNVSEEDYYRALSVSVGGTAIILRRKVSEIYVNNYNPEWIRAWNGNLDLQVCLDYFSIITYITDYFTKEESAVTEVLKQTAKHCAQLCQQDRMQLLLHTFLKHRQMGLSEAFYRLIPNLHLKDSNVTCNFVNTNFRSQRSKFLQKVCDETDSPIHDNKTGNLLRVEGKEGLYRPKVSIHEKYDKRPVHLDKISLAQFATVYDSIPSGKVSHVKFNDNISELTQTSIVTWEQCQNCTDGGVCETCALPKYIRLQDDMGFMCIRSFPSVLRIHNFKADKDPHQYFYSQLILYHPWREVEVAAWENDLQECIGTFYETNTEEDQKPELERRTKVEQTKLKLFPSSHDIEEARNKLAQSESTRTSTIGDLLDCQVEQENQDGASEGVVDDERFISFDPTQVLQANASDESAVTERSVFKPIVIDKADMLRGARQLTAEQRIVFDKTIGFCKDLRKTCKSENAQPEPLRIVTHAAAGCGKSKLITELSRWAHYFLRREGDSSAVPYVVKAAPTGMAAHIIDGVTLHSAFNLMFGNQHNSLSDEKRESFRNTFSNLEILIIDEISMLKSDLLHQLHLRLQEVKQSQLLFGGVSILLFGDLMQLKPVMGSFIFEQPRCKDYNIYHSIAPLWNNFSFVELTKNHRQGSDLNYANLLNRVRFGQQTEEDLNTLKTRLRPPEHPDIAQASLYVFGTTKLVNEYNQKRLSGIPGEVVTASAINIHPTLKDYSPTIDNRGTVNGSPFLASLSLKKNARVMLTYNVDTSDGLTNGSRGTVVDFIRSERDDVTTILVAFDDMSVGALARQKSRTKATPITRVTFKYNLGQRRRNHMLQAKVIQFPITLCWAATAHKMQGQTIKAPHKVATDLSSVFGPAQAYVILGRVQNIQQIFLTSLPPNKIYCSKEAKIETERIATMALNRNPGPWFCIQPQQLRLSTVNINRFLPHKTDLMSDSTMLQSDIIFLTETWTDPQTAADALNVPGYRVIHASVGNGRGVAMYVKGLTDSHTTTVVTSNFQIVTIETNDFIAVGVYRSDGGSTMDLLNHIEKHGETEKLVIVLGDLNIDFRTGNSNVFIRNMTQMGFTQHVTSATHLAGNIIDHVYSRNVPLIDLFSHPVYYSDHDGLCVLLSLSQQR